jgi:hypothetical protein
MASHKARKETEFCLSIGIEPEMILRKSTPIGQRPNRRTVRYDLADDIREWCAENLKEQFYFGTYPKYNKPFRVFFENDVDMLLFKMRWF